MNPMRESEMILLISITSKKCYGSVKRQHHGLCNWPLAEVGCYLDLEGMNGIQISNDCILKDAFKEQRVVKADDRMKDLYKITEKMWVEKFYRQYFRGVLNETVSKSTYTRLYVKGLEMQLPASIFF